MGPHNFYIKNRAIAPLDISKSALYLWSYRSIGFLKAQLTYPLAYIPYDINEWYGQDAIAYT